MLGHYVRERKLLTLEQAIHKMTQLPASRLGWTDRGRIAASQCADVIVFDPKTVTALATFAKPHRHSTGISEVIVFGRRTLAGGKMTGNLSGMPVTLERQKRVENRAGR